MSHQMRRALAAVGVTAALLLAAPSPSRAASFQGPVLTGGLVEQVWLWLWSLMPAPVTERAVKNAPPVKTETTSVPPPPVSPPPNNEQGSMIDPDGKP